MIWINCRKLFKKWKLSEKESFFGTVVIYEIQWLVKIERFFQPTEKMKLHDMLWNIFREFEYEEWMVLTARQISYILGVDHTTIDRTIERIKYKIKQWMHL